MRQAAELQLVVATEHMDRGHSTALREACVGIRMHAVSAELTWLRTCLPWCPGPSAHLTCFSSKARCGEGRFSRLFKEKVELNLVR